MHSQMALFKANRNLTQCRDGGWVEITVQCCLVCEALGLISQPTKKKKKKRQPATFVFDTLPNFHFSAPTDQTPTPPHTHTKKNLMVLATSATFL